MLGDVNTKITDGLLGLDTAKGEGVHVKIGASPVEASAPVIITGGMTVSKIRERLGNCPLSDSVMDSVENGSNCIYCIPVAAGVPGTCQDVEKNGGGTGALTVAGSPHNAFEVIVRITGKGGLNSALFSCSLDGGASFSDEMTVPLTGIYDVPASGLTLTFTEGEPSENTAPFHAGDTFAFSTTAPSMTNAGVLDAIDKLRHFNELFELVHIAGESQKALWCAVSEKQRELSDTYHKPLLFVMEAYRPGESEDLYDYAFGLAADKKAVGNTDIQVVAAWSRYIGMDGVPRRINNAGIVCGLYAKTGVHQSIGRTRDTAGMCISKTKLTTLLPAGIEDVTDILDDAKYLTFREYDGLEGFFVTNARVLSPEGSDYRYAEDTRVKNKIIREVRKTGLQLLQDDVDLENVQGELEARAKFMETPLDEMVRRGELSSASITVPEGQDIIATETMAVVIRYVSKGYIRSITVDIGRTRP